MDHSIRNTTPTMNTVLSAAAQRTQDPEPEVHSQCLLGVVIRTAAAPRAQAPVPEVHSQCLLGVQ